MASPMWGDFNVNLDKIPRPFLIGVAGGTASGKVRAGDLAYNF